MIHSFATDCDDPTIDARDGRVGKQKIEDTGPLTKKRMEPIDDDIAERSARPSRTPQKVVDARGALRGGAGHD